MKELRKSHCRYAINLPDGEQIRGYALYGERGEWLGYVTLEYSAAGHRLRMYSITDYGNYAYEWPGAGDKGYAHFLLGCDNAYITGKMATGHDEHRILLPDETCESVWLAFEAAHSDDDADWLGEARSALERCECESDFFAWEANYNWDDVYMDFQYGWGGYLNGYCRRLLPELKRMLREELEKA